MHLPVIENDSGLDTVLQKAIKSERLAYNPGHGISMAILAQGLDHWATRSIRVIEAYVTPPQKKIGAEWISTARDVD